MSREETRALRARIQYHEFLLSLLVFLNLFQIWRGYPEPAVVIMLIAFGLLTGLAAGRMAQSLYGEISVGRNPDADTEAD